MVGGKEWEGVVRSNQSSLDGDLLRITNLSFGAGDSL